MFRTIWKGIFLGISPFGRVKFREFPLPGSMDDDGATDRKPKKLSKSLKSLGFTNSKTKDLTKTMDENSGTERFIAARKVGALQTQADCTR